MRTLWPSTVVIEANLSQQVAMVRKALGTTGHRYLMTHPGRGYSLAEPVRVIPVAEVCDRPALERAPPGEDKERIDDEPSDSTKDQTSAAEGAHSLAGLPRSARIALGLILTVTVAFACVWWLRQPPSPTQSASRSPSQRSVLAILPFQNLSNDPEQEYLSDGLTEETIADLGELSPESLGVIARTSAMTYRHTSKSVTQIGNELGAD